MDVPPCCVGKPHPSLSICRILPCPSQALGQPRRLILSSLPNNRLENVLENGCSPALARSNPLLRSRRRHATHFCRPVRATPPAVDVAIVADSRAPIHPEAMNTLYFMYMCACLTERTWRFALPLCLAFVEGGYQAIAVLGFVSPLACSLIGPAAGRLMDRMYRPYGLSMMVTLQGLAIIASGLVMLAAAANPTMKFVDGPLFLALLVLSMMERLTAIASELVIERDWVTQLSGKDNALALASSNAMLRRTDLSCELIGSLAFGWLYSCSGLAVSVASATFLALVLLPAQLFSIFRIAKLAPDAMVHGRDETDIAMFKLPWKRLLGKHRGLDDRPPPKPLGQRIKTQVLHSLDGWKAYFRQPILPSSLTFVILFFNVALSPGGLITAFLTAKGLDGTGMAIFRGGCAVMGFTGTWVGRRLIQRYGLLGAGQRALSIQGWFLGAATLAYIFFLSAPLVGESAVVAATNKATAVGLTIFSSAVVLSRIGMWSFDMVNAQLYQQNVSQREVASASAAEMALCAFCELLMLGLAAYVIGPESFRSLIYLSFTAVLAANGLFGWWAKNSTIETDGSEEESGPGQPLLAPAPAA